MGGHHGFSASNMGACLREFKVRVGELGPRLKVRGAEESFVTLVFYFIFFHLFIYLLSFIYLLIYLYFFTSKEAVQGQDNDKKNKPATRCLFADR